MPKWVAYCIECHKDLTNGGWNNGQMVEAQGEFHLRGELEKHDRFKTHHVIIGYIKETK